MELLLKGSMLIIFSEKNLDPSSTGQFARDEIKYEDVLALATFIGAFEASLKCGLLVSRFSTDDELAQLPHVLMTSDDPWDPHSLDSEPDDLHLFNAEMYEGIKEAWVECSDDYGEVLDEQETESYYQSQSC